MFIKVTLPVISLLIFGRSAGQELLTVRVGAAIPGLWYTSKRFPGSYGDKTCLKYHFMLLMSSQKSFTEERSKSRYCLSRQTKLLNR